MARWTNGRLDLGALGEASLSDLCDGWAWQLVSPYGVDIEVGGHYPTPARARRAAEGWLKRALKQASRRLATPPAPTGKMLEVRR